MNHRIFGEGAKRLNQSRKKWELSPWDKWLPPDRQGLKVWKNKKNGFTVMQLHYTADPDKRSAEWRAKESQGISKKDWDVEMELSWHTYGGEAVYAGAFHRLQHVAAQPMLPDPALPFLIRGWDTQTNHSCAIVQLQGQRLVVLDELPNLGRNTRAFTPKVISFCHVTYGTEFEFVDVVDPSAKDEGKTATGDSCTDIMHKEFGLNPILSPSQDPDIRKDAVIKFLMTLNEDGRPNMLINPHCQMLISGFEGGYQYPEKELQTQRGDRPLKNEWSHIHDGLQYAAVYAASGALEKPEIDYEYINQNLPKYSFTR